MLYSVQDREKTIWENQYEKAPKEVKIEQPLKRKFIIFKDFQEYWYASFANRDADKRVYLKF